MEIMDIKEKAKDLLNALANSILERDANLHSFSFSGAEVGVAMEWLSLFIDEIKDRSNENV
jgi:hypothetical protein